MSKEWKPIEEYDALEVKPAWCVFWSRGRIHDDYECCSAIDPSVWFSRPSHYMEVGSPD